MIPFKFKADSIKCNELVSVYHIYSMVSVICDDLEVWLDISMMHCCSMATWDMDSEPKL